MEAPDASVRTSADGPYSKRLIELDGTRDGPVDHGLVDDFLKVRNNPLGSDTPADLLFFIPCVHLYPTGRM